MRGGLALERAARYTSAEFPTSGAEGAQQCERGAPMARQFLLASAIPLQHQIFSLNSSLSHWPNTAILLTPPDIP